MKKLLILLAAAFVVCVPEPSYAESQKPSKPERDELAKPALAKETELVVIGANMINTNRELTAVAEDLRIVTGKPIEFMYLALLTIEVSYLSYASTGYILTRSPWIKDEFRTEWRLLTAEIMMHRKSYLKEVCLKRLQKSHSIIEPPAALDKVDKARDIIQSSLPLFDKALQILEPKTP